MTTILITGAGSGIGAATAQLLADRGVDVIAGVRPGGGENGALGTTTSPRIWRVPLDVTDAESIASAFAAIDERLGGAGLDGVVDNAGVAIAGPLEILPIERLRLSLETNVIGQVAVVQAALPLLRRVPGGARIVIVGSIAGKLAAEFGGAYHASKFALEAVADILRQELEPESIDVTLIEPAAIATPIWDKAIAGLDELLASGVPGLVRYRERLLGFRDSLGSARDHGLDVTEVAEAIAAALLDDDPPTRRVVGTGGRLATALKPLLPDRVADKLTERTAE
jgi:NAD(P)-dependent dehydrogenase (short-subunit alcohol dehydrogenase family)